MESYCTKLKTGLGDLDAQKKTACGDGVDASAEDSRGLGPGLDPCDVVRDRLSDLRWRAVLQPGDVAGWMHALLQVRAPAWRA